MASAASSVDCDWERAMSRRMARAMSRTWTSTPNSQLGMLSSQMPGGVMSLLMKPPGFSSRVTESARTVRAVWDPVVRELLAPTGSTFSSFRPGSRLQYQPTSRQISR